MKLRFLGLGCIAGCLLFLNACQQDDSIQIHSNEWPELMDIPTGFPAIEEPADNTFSPARWALGKRLFFDKALSIDSSISCASCHLPALAFSDNEAFSPGVFDAPGVRNAPSLTNVAYLPYYTREGGIPSLELQVLIPIQETNEFNHNMVELIEQIRMDQTYRDQALDAYGIEFDAFVLTRALACFERSLISGHSPFDDYFYRGQSSLNGSELRGMDLFFSDSLACSSCHGGFNFTENTFENNGLYENYADSGRFRLTQDSTDLARFKTPTLRNIELTAPYMHDGSIWTLEEVIQHYASGGQNHFNKSPILQGFSLTEEEQSDLIAFLKSLTDESFISNPLFAEP